MMEYCSTMLTTHQALETSLPSASETNVSSSSLTPEQVRLPLLCYFLFYYNGSFIRRFQAGGRRKRPNLGLVSSFYFVLSSFLS